MARIAAAVLATAAPTACRAEKVSFPTDHPIGILKIADAEEPESSNVRDYAVHPAWECLGPAVGEIQIPAGRRVYLHVTGHACAELARLRPTRPLPITELAIDGERAPSLPGDDALRAAVAAFPMLTRVSIGTSAISNTGLAALAVLPSLRQLHVHMPGLDDSGLAHIARVQGLASLSLGGAGAVTPDGWAVLASMTNLQDFGLERKDLPPAVVAALARAPKLRRFFANATGIGIATLETLAASPGLESLRLFEIGTTEEIAQISGATGLQELHLGSVHTHADLSPIARLDKLRTLRLSGPISDTTFSTLPPMRGLETLNIHDGGSFGGPPPEARASDRLLKHVGQMTGLREISIWHGGPFTDAGIAHIANLPGLRSLTIPNGHGLTDGSTRILAHAANLQSLYLRGDGITDATPRALATLRDLRSLRFLTPFALSDAGLAAIGSITSIEDLHLYSTNITRAGACRLTQLPRLRELDLGRLRDTGGPPLDFGQCKNLEKLELVGANDGDLAALANHPGLIRLSVQGPITGAGLRHIATLTQLEALSVSGDTRLTDADLACLSSLHRLTYLTLKGDLSPAGIKTLSPLRGLLCLSVGPKSIEPAERDQLRDLFPCLQYLTAPSPRRNRP